MAGRVDVPRHASRLNVAIFSAGRDAMESREGGTWLGASTRGRVGVLLNILTDTGPLPDKTPRGVCVCVCV